jgi:hypothetical protein
MRKYCYLFLLILSGSLYGKEWKNLKVYQNITHQEKLSPKDWLRADRIHCTTVWNKANLYNIDNNLPQEYLEIIQRRDFYEWANKELFKKGHEVVWISMSYFISKKLHIMESFPFSIAFDKRTLQYVNDGSEVVFNNAFKELKIIFNSKKIFKGSNALVWDKDILHKEQFEWIEKIYENMDKRSLKTVKRIAKGKFPFSVFVPKSIRFKEDISNPEARYQYAVKVLRPYCEISDK